ncbi:putative Dihydroxyacetone phosphate acyltransferase [Operophtera brumata]|uniref:Putative Dihydroxyacetone phosphate acyltransferase n=1 Tax=Operophtera brumata TaxID=104452 RepID=A0A0L7LP78_OPEBR|nr:putative Dihydroxyacetone phosphate acyltransferase [Operophtera brumata]
MAVIGRRMRETCAFYIRRTLAGAPLYAATLKQYVRTVVAQHCAPIEFFLEGTRIREYLQKETSHPHELLKPRDLQQITPDQFKSVQDVADHVITMQQDCTVATITNLMALVLMQSLINNEPLAFPDLLQEVQWMMEVLNNLGAKVFENDVKSSVERILVVHRKMMTLDRERRLRLETSHPHELLKPRDLQQITPDQFKSVQDVADHVITMQQDCTVATITNLMALVLMQSLINNEPLAFPDLLQEVQWMMEVLNNLGAKVFENDVKSSVERILVVHRKMMTSHSERGNDGGGDTRNTVTATRVVSHHDTYGVGEDKKLQHLLKWSVWPALTTLSKCVEVMTQRVTCEHRQALKLIQQSVESVHLNG